jgi:hypothetical protein
VRSLQDRIAFIINIYQHSKFIQSAISILLQKNAKYIPVIEILLALILVDGRGTITSKERNERTTLHCVESYLYYIILVNKQIFSEE